MFQALNRWQNNDPPTSPFSIFGALTARGLIEANPETDSFFGDLKFAPFSDGETHMKTRLTVLVLSTLGTVLFALLTVVSVAHAGCLTIFVCYAENPSVLAETHPKLGESGGPRYPILRSSREISYRCFQGCQKYFWRPSRSLADEHQKFTGW